ncbi:uncharacterized protein LOC141630633 [Silene latifolia]|uniref:uncharacterized protein LOC141630633 n=1 Tax=Silene latifolia TaxID=37657 RepID=UPI003D76FE82
MEPIAEEEDLVEMLQFTSEDIKPEVEFWKSSVFCYVLGANPPWNHIKDYVYNVWKKGKVKVVPIWIRLVGIPLKFWGKCLPKIAGLVGNFVQLDGPTVDKIQLSYARVLVELKMDQSLLDQVKFLDESGKVVTITVAYEWKPITCTSCNGIGHISKQCRKPVPKKGRKQIQRIVPKPQNPPKQVWRPVQKPQTVIQSPSIFPPEAFPLLDQVRMTLLVKSTPAKQFMRINRQGGLDGIRLFGKFSPYTFADALISNATPGGGVVESGKDPPEPNTNSYVELWDFLKQVANQCSDPRIWLGDFNSVLSPIERLGGHTTEIEMEQFQECASLCCLEDILPTGALYTWSNKQEASERVYSRLDRAMGNLEWMAMFGDYIAHFHPKGLFDHCPCTVVNRRADLGGKRSFKYFNMWGKAADFKSSVLSVWRGVYTSTKMFGVIKKLKPLKPVLKKLNHTYFSDIENTTAMVGLALENIQKALVDNPGDLNLIQQELDLASDLKELTVARDSFLSQKAKIQWSIEGDLNTAFLHHAIKKRIMMNMVFHIENKDGRLCTEGSDI